RYVGGGDVGLGAGGGVADFGGGDADLGGGVAGFGDGDAGLGGAFSCFSSISLAFLKSDQALFSYPSFEQASPRYL
ncbi:MAG: hypothetical protein ACYT04_96710, partial [Nostoc sp.]